MKKITGFILILLLTCIYGKSIAQTVSPAAPVKEKQYEMKQYFLVMLSKGNNRTQDSSTAARIQEGHMANITRLAGEGKIVVAGPFGDDGNWRGIFIFDCKTKEEVESLIKTDPAIQTGRLSYEIKPWWTAKNCLFK
ncbi:MAG TPA: YciI family protein [Flavitalea sp.]|nr:YciI family protein [Flavitalea sp.]